MKIERTLSPKGMILDICSMRSRAQKLLTLNPEYAALLNTITAKDYYNDDELKIPTVKDLAADAEISYGVARRQLGVIYDHLCSYEEHLDFPFDFHESTVLISINGIYGHRTITVRGMPHIPRKGEMFQVPYFKELTGTDYYHVDEIYHELMDGKQQVFISLKYGSYDSYWKLRKDQARATREISWHDASMKSDDELKEMLNLKPGKAW